MNIITSGSLCVPTVSRTKVPHPGDKPEAEFCITAKTVVALNNATSMASGKHDTKRMIVYMIVRHVLRCGKDSYDRKEKEAR
jgi:hypothetical protein